MLPELLEIAMPRTRRPYPSDLCDEEWALLEPLLASSERRGRPPKWPSRRVADAVFYLLRSGCAWRMLLREYSPWQTVYYHFRRWRLDGRLRIQVLPRRWVVERTFAWLSQARRLSKDYERLPETGEAMIYGAMSRIMLRRLARAA